MLLMVTALLGIPGIARGAARDGRLAVQPVRGRGIELVAPNGSAAHRVCTTIALCGHPVAPAFSPNGRGIVFSAGGGRIAMITPDGTCLWCLGPRPLSARGAAPAFEGDRALTFLAGGSLLRAALIGTRPRTLIRGGVSAAASSPGGRLAVVRRGWITVGGRRLVRGAAPSWSPSGRAIAYAHAGWIWRIGLGGGRPERLARGARPAWSPDGRTVAFLAPGDRVSVVGVSGGRVRRVGSVRGRSVSWQALPARRDPCASGRGRVIASSSTLVARRYLAARAVSPTVTACLRLTGQTRTVVTQFAGGDGSLTITRARAAGRYLALDELGSPGAGSACSSTVFVYNLGAPTPASGRDLASGGCPNGITAVALNPLGDAAWTSMADTQGMHDLTGISCPTSTFCAATTGASRSVYVTSDPGGGAWQAIALSGSPLPGLDGISCPTASFCLATADGGVYLSSDPAGGPGAWSFEALPGTPSTATPSCPSAEFCGVSTSTSASTGARQLGLLFSSAPTQPGSWRTVDLSSPSGIAVSGLSCPTASFCAATTFGDHAVHVSTDPSAAQPSLTTTVLPMFATDDVSCMSASACVVVGAPSTEGPEIVETTTQPTGGAGAWTAGTAPVGAGSSLSCDASGQCLVSGGAAGAGLAPAAISSDPVGGASWQALPNAPAGVPSCAGPGFCALASGGLVFTSTAPASGAFQSTRLDGAPCWVAGTSCAQPQLTLADAGGLRLLDMGPLGTSSIGAVRFTGPGGRTLAWRDGGRTHTVTVR